MILCAQIDEHGCPIRVLRTYELPEGFVELPSGFSTTNSYRIMFVEGEWFARPIVDYPEIPEGSVVDIYLTEGKVFVRSLVSPEALTLDPTLNYFLDIQPPPPFLSTIIEVKATQ